MLEEFSPRKFPSLVVFFGLSVYSYCLFQLCLMFLSPPSPPTLFSLRSRYKNDRRSKERGNNLLSK